MPYSARLEIHEINVGQGDSVLIINRDLEVTRDVIGAEAANALDPIHYVPYAVAHGIGLEGTVKRALLIDGGDDEYGGDVLEYLRKHGVLQTVPGTNFLPSLALLVSHFHDDHMAGLRSIFKKRVTPVRKNQPITFQDHLRPAAVYQLARNSAADPATQRFEWFQADVVEAGSQAGGHRTECIEIGPAGLDLAGNPVSISLGTGVNGIDIRLDVVAASQWVYDPVAGRPVAVPSAGSRPDQNDRSIVLVLEYGSFRYFVGGDIGGNGKEGGGNFGANSMDTADKKFFSVHADVESRLGPLMEARYPATERWIAGRPKYPCAGYCTAIKVNHHGSSSSMDVYSLATMRPCVAVISAGVKSRFHRHPTQQVMDRLRATPDWPLRPVHPAAVPTFQTPNTVQQVYLTEVAQRVRGTEFGVDLRGGLILGDIVLRPVDESVAAVHAATAPGTPLYLQVYGTGEQTWLESGELRPTADPSPGGPTVYPLGPFDHGDIH